MNDTTFYFQVRNNVDIYRTTVDLETNLNKTTWQVTEEQAEYITDVKVYRDGLLVGIVPYEQGYFLDNIGSDNAARNYRIVGVSVEGEDCPIESYEKGTIHTTYYEDVNGNLNMTWNVPYVEAGAQGTLTYFQICKYDPNTGEITVVDQVNASITDYTCGVNQFDGGYAVIAAVFNDGKGLEELSFSNLTTDILGLGENDGNVFKVYPIPARSRFTVEGTGTLTVTNTLGQTLMTKEIDGQTSIELSQGMYFVRLGGATRGCHIVAASSTNDNAAAVLRQPYKSSCWNQTARGFFYLPIAITPQIRERKLHKFGNENVTNSGMKTPQIRE